MINLFPYFLCRIGGESYEELAKLDLSPEFLARIDGILAAQKELNADKEIVCDLLHGHIATETDSRQQNQLLNLKRNIFNNKTLREKDLNDLHEIVSPTVLQKLSNYRDKQDVLAKTIADCGDLFKREISDSRTRLKGVAQLESLQKGLLLSSQLLLNNIQGYVERDPATLRKKELKTEESLVKYLTRMMAKTSPFSTFTNLAMGTVEPQTKPEKILKTDDNGPKQVTSHICLNNYLYSFFKTVLLHLPEVYRQIPLRPNPTIRFEDENFVFLTNSNNIEAFQRIGNNPVVELFYELVKDHQQGIACQALIDDIITNEYFDAEAPEIEAYLNQLVSYGFLEFNLGVSGIDPFWDKKLIEVLKSIQAGAPVVGALIDALVKVREMAETYQKSAIGDRRRIIKEAHSILWEIAIALHEIAGLPEEERKTPEERSRIAAEKKAAKGETEEKEEVTEEKPEEDETFTHQSNTYFHFKPEQIFYEDTSCNVTPAVSTTEAAGILEPLHKLLTGLQDYDGLLDDGEKMLQYFTTKYPNQETIDVMTFYEDYYREIKRPEVEQANKQKEQADKPAEEKTVFTPIITVEATTKRHEANRARMDKLVDLVKESVLKKADHIDLKPLHLGQDTFELPDDALRSYGAFLQPFRENGKLKAVINASFPGYGKMFSRFLHLLPAELTSEIRAWNKPDEKTEIFIENCDASFFNANLHPPLMPYEIWMPGGQNTLPASEQIPITDLSLVYQKDNNQLVLKHKETRKTAHVFDLGFQGAKGRSPLFQLLSRFSLIKALFWQHATQSINVQYRNAEAEKSEEPIICPRITFEDSLIIQRKNWWFKNETLPQLLPTETEWDYFLKVNLWRKKYGLPDEVFIFITNHNEMQTLKPEQMTKLGRDSYKPQYINFNNAVLICNLFEKMLSKAPVGIKLEEMLPNSKQMFSLDGTRYVTEFVMQWYTGCEKQN